MTHLQDLQRSIQNAEEFAMEHNEDNQLPFADMKQVVTVSILIARALTEPYYAKNPRKYVHRDIRLAVLRELFDTKRKWLTTSRLISYAGARRLLELAFGYNITDYNKARTEPMFEDTVLAIQEAAEGLFEAKYPDGKVLRKVPVDRQGPEES